MNMGGVAVLNRLLHARKEVITMDARLYGYLLLFWIGKGYSRKTARRMALIQAVMTSR